MKKLLLLNLLVSCGAWADCSNIDSSTDKRECYQQKLKFADQKLLSTYQESLRMTSSESKQKLIKAQDTLQSTQSIQLLMGLRYYFS